MKEASLSLSELFDSEIYKVLSAPTYPLAEASRLVGVSSWRVSAWLRGYDITYKNRGPYPTKIRQQPVLRGKPRREVFASFLDLIDLLFVKKFLEQGLTLQRVRKALGEAREVLEIPHFASTKFFAFGKRIIVEKPETSTKNLYTLLTGGQLAFREIVESVAEKIDFEQVSGYELAARWYPLGQEGKVVIDPQVSYGRPTIVGKATRTANIYDLYLGEDRQVAAVEHWFELPPDEIEAAVRFEENLVTA